MTRLNLNDSEGRCGNTKMQHNKECTLRNRGQLHRPIRAASRHKTYWYIFPGSLLVFASCVSASIGDFTVESLKGYRLYF